RAHANSPCATAPRAASLRCGSRLAPASVVTSWPAESWRRSRGNPSSSANVLSNPPIDATLQDRDVSDHGEEGEWHEAGVVDLHSDRRTGGDFGLRRAAARWDTARRPQRRPAEHGSASIHGGRRPPGLPKPLRQTRRHQPEPGDRSDAGHVVADHRRWTYLYVQTAPGRR